MKETKICVIGLGYVGLPLARLFSTKYPTVGFDMNQKRCDALMAGHDATLEVADDILQDAIKNHESFFPVEKFLIEREIVKLRRGSIRK